MSVVGLPFEENFWSEDSYYLNINSTSGVTPVESPPLEMPTPPRSPTMSQDLLLESESPFSNVEMVNPNSILDESHRLSDTLHGLSLNLPFLETIDPKMDPWSSLISCEFGFPSDLCPHECVKNFCNLCFDDKVKTEIVNDCMWTAGTSIHINNSPTATSSPLLRQQQQQQQLHHSSYARVHTDSVSSKYSDIVDPLAGVIASMDPDEFSPTCKLETPSESSDADTDAEEGRPTAGNIHLEHNYHLSCSRRQNSDIASPLRRALTKVSMVQTDSDDEIDVVNFCGNDTLTSTRVDNFYSLDALNNSVDQSVSVVVGSVSKRGRKAVSSSLTVPRKVGRPCKNVKRLGGRVDKPISRRYGARSIQMDPQKRNLHNSMERLRRVDLKKCFDIVRANIPSLRDRTRAPKVLILQSATEFVKSLEKKVRQSELELLRLRDKQMELQRELQTLIDKHRISGKEFG